MVRPATIEQSVLLSDREDVRLATELIYLGHNGLMRGADALLSRHGLGRAHYRVLYAIAREPGAAVGELLSALRISAQALNRVMRELQSAGHVRQVAAQADRRVRHNHLTDSGHAIQAEIYAYQAERFAGAFDRIGPEASAGFLRVLHAFIDPSDAEWLYAPRQLSYRMRDDPGPSAQTSRLTPGGSSGADDSGRSAARPGVDRPGSSARTGPAARGAS